MKTTKASQQIEEQLVKRVADTSGNLESKVKMHDWIIVSVVVVVVVSFVALILTAGALVNDSLAEKKAISLDMRDKINKQDQAIENLSTKIDSLTEQLKQSQKTTSTNL